MNDPEQNQAFAAALQHSMRTAGVAFAAVNGVAVSCVVTGFVSTAVWDAVAMAGAGPVKRLLRVTLDAIEASEQGQDAVKASNPAYVAAQTEVMRAIDANRDLWAMKPGGPTQ